ncbi:flagellar hook-length control protein FliK [Pseudomonas sp. BCA14]|uniref:type III secretion system HrpP C-terminal domain-containing protein n=1 Tax=unclassified Pseudomonas TaxID=196821 RepID=UPI00106EB213|nr:MULTISPECIES: type III secretion system HrpP C-terminal domain-containing protein [unclassified Pseudomonas]TFF10223.1 flagellar hook-length control protein FliK [Pseudomonas sp. JMN1]TFF12365.1 flagellar hook-length control protein FliK [Pseudomonas sp. BCA17]TFF25758.1 flagellar hook-length control protein FliK [Pseudomonas sp. BCA13]TFF29141.1 flagellar hook-length control protein FliK [Pseudomonas sp. BCA14]
MTQVPADKVERSRPRELRDTREAGAGVVIPDEHGQLFRRLFVDEGEPKGYGSHAAAGRSAAAEIGMIQTLAEQLAPRIHGASQWPLEATLYLPRLGRIQARIRREHNTWNVELDAEHDTTTRWLSGVRQRCEDRIAQAVGEPVSLHLVHLERT